MSSSALAATVVTSFPYGADPMTQRFATNETVTIANSEAVLPSTANGPMPATDSLARVVVNATDFTAIDGEEWPSGIADIVSASPKAVLTMRVTNSVNNVDTYSWMGWTQNKFVELYGIAATSGVWKTTIDFDYTTQASTYLVRYRVERDSQETILTNAAGAAWLPMGTQSPVATAISCVKLKGTGSVASAYAESAARAGAAEICEPIENYSYSYDQLKLAIVVTNVWGLQDLKVTISGANVSGGSQTITQSLVANATNVIDLSNYVTPGSKYTYTVEATGSYQGKTFDNQSVVANQNVTMARVQDGWFGFNSASHANVFYNATTANIEVVDSAFRLVDDEEQGHVTAVTAAATNTFVTVEAVANVEAALLDDQASDLGSVQGAITIRETTADSVTTRTWARWNPLCSSSTALGKWESLSGTGVGTANGTYYTRAEFDYSGTPGKVRYSVKTGSDGSYVVLKDSSDETWFNVPSGSNTLVGVSLLGAGSVSSLAGSYTTVEASTNATIDASKKEIAIESNTELSLKDDKLVSGNTYTVTANQAFKLSWKDEGGKSAKLVGNKLTVIGSSPVNGRSSYESYLLGLDSEKEASQPFVKADKTASTSSVTLTVANIQPKSEAESGVPIKFQLQQKTAGGTWENVDSATSDSSFTISLPTGSGVRYYRANIKFGK